METNVSYYAVDAHDYEGNLINQDGVAKEDKLVAVYQVSIDNNGVELKNNIGNYSINNLSNIVNSNTLMLNVVQTHLA